MFNSPLCKREASMTSCMYNPTSLYCWPNFRAVLLVITCRRPSDSVTPNRSASGLCVKFATKQTWSKMNKLIDLKLYLDAEYAVNLSIIVRILNSRLRCKKGTQTLKMWMNFTLTIPNQQTEILPNSILYQNLLQIEDVIK